MRKINKDIFTCFHMVKKVLKLYTQLLITRQIHRKKLKLKQLKENKEKIEKKNRGKKKKIEKNKINKLNMVLP